MNRKNLTAAVLAGLAGIAGIAGTAQAVNLNPDGLGQVLIYPYYTTNGGNQTVLSVVNTTDAAKAVKVRFLEGFNSREVLDFNLYMSPWDVWVAAIADDAGVPTLYIPDNSCTVPYLYGDFDGKQAFLSLAYNDNALFSNDGGPVGIERAAEGHFEMIEMGTLIGDSAADATHVSDGDGGWAPADCAQLVTNWTRDADYSPMGDWTLDPQMDMARNSGGMFGGAAIVNPENGTMYSYNAQAIQGYDKTEGERHEEPGTIHPSLNEGSERTATIFFGVPSNRAVDLSYNFPVEAVSAVFMHENIMNEYTLSEALSASTEWIVTFPTKNFYVDEDIIDFGLYWEPDVSDPGCGGWMPGDLNPAAGSSSDPNGNIDGWEQCTFLSYEEFDAYPPFTETFDGTACEEAVLKTWDRDERTFSEERSGTRPPVVSPSLPGDCDPEIQFCEDVHFQLCYEVNVMRFGEGSIFDTPVIEGNSLLLSVQNEFENGWGRIDFDTQHPVTGARHIDTVGLVGLPVTGFAAFEFENNFLDGGVRANYGGLFMHRGNVRRGQAHRHYVSDK